MMLIILCCFKIVSGVNDLDWLMIFQINYFDFMMILHYYCYYYCFSFTAAVAVAFDRNAVAADST